MTSRLYTRTGSTAASLLFAATFALLLCASPANAQNTAAPACNGNGAMWMSIAHPGLGEMKNSGQGWSGIPKKKFWLGFIPFFGWPGYLQVVSAIDAKHCRTNDWPN